MMDYSYHMRQQYMHATTLPSHPTSQTMFGFPRVDSQTMGTHYNSYPPDQAWIAPLVELRLAIKERELYQRTIIEEDESRSYSSLIHHFRRLNAIVLAHYRLDVGVSSGWGPARMTPPSAVRESYVSPPKHYRSLSPLRTTPEVHFTVPSESRRILSLPRDVADAFLVPLAQICREEQEARALIRSSWLQYYYALAHHFVGVVLPMVRTAEGRRLSLNADEQRCRATLAAEEQYQLWTLKDTAAKTQALLLSVLLSPLR